MEKVKVLSLFDGISCGMVALERAGYKVERYYAYEIEPSAITISKKKLPGDHTTGGRIQYRFCTICSTGNRFLIRRQPVYVLE